MKEEPIIADTIADLIAVLTKYKANGGWCTENRGRLPSRIILTNKYGDYVSIVQTSQ